MSAVVALALVASACAQASSPQENPPETTADSAAEPGDTDATPDPSSPAGDDEGSGSPAESASAFLDLPANPLPVTFSTDDSASISAEIGTDGGSLVTTDANGVVFTLTIPDGALLSPATITMTPVALTDSPFENASAAAVSLEPDGLVLMEPATLTILKPGLDATTSLFFSSDNGGGDFGVVSGNYGDVIEMAVPHFSISGLLGAMANREISAVVSEYRPSSRDGRYQQEIQTLQDRVDDPTQRYNAQKNVLVDWFKAVEDDASSADDEGSVSRLIRGFISAVAASTRLDIFVLPDTTPPTEARAKASRAVQKAVSRLFDKENLRCIRDRNPNAMFSMFRWFLIYLFLGVTTSGDTALQPAMETAIRNCAQFKVEFFSTVVLDTLTVRVGVEVVLKAFADGDLSAGFVDLPTTTGLVTGFTTGEPVSCQAKQPVDVGLVLVFDANINTIADATLFDPLVSMRFPAHLEWSCGGMPDGVSMTPEIGDSLWISWFVGGFSDLRSNPSQNAYFFDLERDPSGSLFAAFAREETIQGTIQSVPITVEVILIHDPQLP